MHRLKELRKQAGRSQAYIASLLSITQSNYAKYEKEMVNVPTPNLKILADYYQCSIDYLLGFDDNPESFGARVHDTSWIERKGGNLILSEKVRRLSHKHHKSVEDYVDYLLEKENEGKEDQPK